MEGFIMKIRIKKVTGISSFLYAAFFNQRLSEETYSERSFGIKFLNKVPN